MSLFRALDPEGDEAVWFDRGIKSPLPVFYRDTLTNGHVSDERIAAADELWAVICEHIPARES